jgi:glycosyltransferase involved in cell wall biosynthesis
MKVFFDNKIFYTQKYGGISRYYLNLCKELKNLGVDCFISSPINYNEYLKRDDFQSKIHFNLKKKIKFTGKIFDIYNNFFNNYYSNKFTPDLTHLTYYQKELKFKKKNPIILTVYDLIHEKFARDYNLNEENRFKQNYIDVADKIICISESTKRDLIKYYNVDKKKLSVIYLGIDNFNLPPMKKQNFILFVGDRKRYKNFNILIKAYSITKLVNQNFNICCVGGGDFSEAEKKIFNNLNLTKNIKYIEATDHELIEKYRTASLFVTTSLSEGFGLPVLEAMSCKCKVLASDIPVYRETLKNFGYFFNPSDENDLKNKLESILIENKKIDELNIDEAYNHSTKFTWNNCAKETLKIYEELI